MACTVCAHPKRREIDRELATPGSINRDIARRYGLGKDAMHRHERDHLASRLAAAAVAADAADALSVRRELVERLPALVNAVKQCEVGPPRELFTAWREFRPALELTGKVTREIQPENVTVVRNEILTAIGVASADEARSRLAVLERAESMSAEDRIAACAAYLAAAGWRCLPPDAAVLPAHGAQEGAEDAAGRENGAALGQRDGAPQEAASMVAPSDAIATRRRSGVGLS